MLVAHDSEQPGLEIGTRPEPVDVVESAHQRLLDQVIRAHAIAGERACEGMQLGHEGHHVVSHHLVATFLKPGNPAANELKSRYVVGKVLAARARQSRKGTPEGGRKIP